MDSQLEEYVEQLNHIAKETGEIDDAVKDAIFKLLKSKQGILIIGELIYLLFAYKYAKQLVCSNQDSVVISLCVCKWNAFDPRTGL